MRGLRHGPGAEAPQPLAHGPPGLHPALGLGTSTTTRRSPPPHRPVSGVPATLALGARPARDPPRLGPKDARPGGHTAEACVAVGPERGPRAPRTDPSARAAGRPEHPPECGGPETPAQAAVGPSPAPDAAGRRPRCGRHRASQFRPSVGLSRTNPETSIAQVIPSALTFGV